MLERHNSSHWFRLLFLYFIVLTKQEQLVWGNKRNRKISNRCITCGNEPRVALAVMIARLLLACRYPLARPSLSCGCLVLMARRLVAYRHMHRVHLWTLIDPPCPKTSSEPGKTAEAELQSRPRQSSRRRMQRRFALMEHKSQPPQRSR